VNELVKKRANRPSVLKVDGWHVYISIRDGEYERLVKWWRRKLTAAHPDRGGTHHRFLTVNRAFTRWRMQEAAWYAQCDLLPPDGWKGAASTLNRRRRLRGLPDHG
jgi:hypothetical protein